MSVTLHCFTCNGVGGTTVDDENYTCSTCAGNGTITYDTYPLVGRPNEFSDLALVRTSDEDEPVGLQPSSAAPLGRAPFQGEEKE